MKHYFTKEEGEFIAEELPKGTYEECLEKFNARFPAITRAQLQRYRFRHGIGIGRKSDIWYEAIRSNCFEKGHKCPFAREAGAIRKNSSGFLIKQEDGTWKRMSRVVWEEHYGKIPEGHVIVQVDGDMANFDISNLEMISRNEQSVMNLYKLKPHNRDEFYTCLAIARLKIAMKAQEKKRKK